MQQATEGKVCRSDVNAPDSAADVRSFRERRASGAAILHQKYVNNICSEQQL